MYAFVPPLVSAVALAAAVASTATAQETPGVVSSSGTVTIEKQPDVMRMQVQLLAKARTLKEALATLKDRIAAARSQVVVLGAEKSSIRIGKPELSTAQSEMQKTMQQMMRKQMQRALSKRKKPAPLPVTVAATMTVEWKLTAKDAAGLLLAAHPLQDKIRAADVAGAKEAAKLSPEEQEIFDELKGEIGRGYFPGGEEAAAPGTPVFSFIGRVTETERDKALAEAFGKAKARAARLAKAAGAELGKLRSLSSQTGTGTAPDSDAEAYSRYMLLRGYGRGAPAGDEDSGEAVGTTPGSVTYRVQITAAFNLK